MNLVKIDLQIEDLIEKVTNPETGEISDEAWQQVESLYKTKEEIITNFGYKYKRLVNEAEYWKNEKKRIERYQKVAEGIAERIKLLLGRSIPEGEKIKTPDLEIGWRKSEAVEIDEVLADLPGIAKSDPNLVEIVVTYKPNKTALKEVIKKGFGFYGIELRTKNNIQIK